MKRAAIVIPQLVAGYFLGFMAAYSLSIGNGSELVAFPLGMTLGVWGVGALCKEAGWWRGVTTLIGASSGAVLLSFLVTGFTGIFLPLIGAMLGYYLAKR